MDLSCTILRPNVAGASDRFSFSSSNSHYRHCSRKFLVNPGGLYKSFTTKRLQKLVALDVRAVYPRLALSGQSVNNTLVKLSRNTFLARCQGNDSLAYVNSNGKDVEYVDSGDGDGPRNGDNVTAELVSSKEDSRSEESDPEPPGVEELRELLQKALKDLEVAQLNSTMFEEKAQRISEMAIALRDEAASAWDDVNSTLNSVQGIVNEEVLAKEGVQKATMALSLAEARLQVAIESLEREKKSAPLESSGENGNGKVELSSLPKDEEILLASQKDIKECQDNLTKCEAELRQLQHKKEEFQNEVDRLNEVAEQAQINSLKAEEEVANIMLLAEQAVAFELEAAQRVNDAEITLQKAEKSLAAFSNDAPEDITPHNGKSSPDLLVSDVATHDEEVNQRHLVDHTDLKDIEDRLDGASPAGDFAESQISDELFLSDEKEQENGKPSIDSSKDAEIDAERSNVTQNKKQDLKESKDNSPLSSPKALLKKSSRFFSASFFSAADGDEFTPVSVFHTLIESAKRHLPKLVVSTLLIGAGITFYMKRSEKISQLFQQPEIVTTSIDEVSTNAKPLVRKIRQLPKKFKELMEMLPHQEVNEEEASLFDMLWLLLASVIFVPIFQKIPGGSPVLGYLAAGILIGPYGLSIIRHVHGTKAIAEFGVVFLLFNIGLELSVERLSSMKKYVFGMGSAQVLVTAAVIGFIAHFLAGQSGPAAIVIGNGLALSSTAVVLQVLQERGESTSRHGRATFSVLLFQDLAVVVLLILIPLISPNSSKGGVGFQAIAEALGVAAVKAAVAITAIIAGGRLLLRPIYKQIADMQNAEIFSANTLLVILGTSLLTARAGLSMALGAFLAGLLLAETEFSLQVESDIAPYRGLLLGLFFMTVGMSIDPKLLLSNFPVVMGTLGALIAFKTLLVALIGKLFGVSIISAIRVGLLLAPGGEFAFVAFGEAVNQGIMSSQMSSLLFLVVGISMALTPWLAAGGQLIASRFDLHDVRSLLPVESEVWCMSCVCALIFMMTGPSDRVCY
ncbi:hypothetical protein Leryth_019262 [Lithospermum erythrorhizon]|nr:hypothetical protein Leryth_019262 [Lithospermum erythrorhizon]